MSGRRFVDQVGPRILYETSREILAVGKEGGRPGPGRKAVGWLGSVCSELVLRAFEKRVGSLVKGCSRSPEDWSRIEFRDD